MRDPAEILPHRSPKARMGDFLFIGAALASLGLAGATVMDRFSPGDPVAAVAAPPVAAIASAAPAAPPAVAARAVPTDPLRERLIDERTLRALDRQTAVHYVAGLETLTLAQIQGHVGDLTMAFRDALAGDDDTRRDAAIDQLSLLHIDLSLRAGADLYASQIQALYFDWVAAAR